MREKYLYDSPCSYLEGKQSRTELFLSREKLDAPTLEYYLSRGWRKFGQEFFRPVCVGCQACVPLRVLAQEFKPSKSQRRIKKQNHDLSVQFNSLTYRPEIYQIYLDHTKRFPQEPLSEQHFFYTFFMPSCPSLQSEYYLDGKLIAVGFLDVSSKSFSSVYFIYHNHLQHRKLGIFSILKEIEYAKNLGLDYYYLGFYIAENQRMAYKNQFTPHEKMDWKNDTWTRYTSD